MSTVTITLASDGTPSPSSVQVNPGDTLRFHADGADAVVCIHPAEYFGGERFAIPSGETADLTVQPEASGSFEYIVTVGDLEASCRGSREKAMAGGGGLG